MKKKIAIIGGGPAGLSAAFHLTSEEGWKEKLDITIYQMGWRLGGKGSTGRDEHKDHRLEEHGIHGFCRFYFNTFEMMKKAYGELCEESLARLPVKTMDQAFIGSSYTLGIEHTGDSWTVRPGRLPRKGGKPWEDGDSFTSPSSRGVVSGLLEETIRRGRDGDLDALGWNDLVPATNRMPDPTGAAVKVDQALRRAIRATTEVLDTKDATAALSLALIVQGIDAVRTDLVSLIAAAVDSAREGRDQGALRALTSVDLYLAVFRGLVDDFVLWPGFDLDTLDSIDYRAWLKRHGASPATLDSSSVYAVANMLFAYPEGDTDREPALSAASWLGWFLRVVLGRGDYFYLMAAGTGETVILPLYLLLVERGVRFEFFHRLTSLESGQDEQGRCVVDTLVFDRQAVAKLESGYDPVDVAPQLGFGVWPDQPLLDRLHNGKVGEDYEAWPGIDTVDEVPLRRGEHFDYVVWAIPPSMIPLVGDAELQARWSEVVRCLPTIATQAAQIWLTTPTLELGPECEYPERYATAAFPNPLNGMVSFDDVLGFEGGGPNGPKGLFYLCGPIAFDGEPSEETRPRDLEAVLDNVRETLRQIGHFLPKAIPRPPDPSEPMQIDFALLHTAGGGSPNGPDRLLQQYFRVNSRPTEAYVQAPAGSASGRLDPWDCGYANMVPAGDWIYTGINVGAFEGAVTGGKLAAFALTGKPKVADIEGYDYFHPRAQKRAKRAVRKKRIPLIP